MTTPELTREDLAHLEWARTLGRRGWGRVHPNPMVGCVIVREGRVVGEGFHESYGGPHAEIVALERARSAAEGATVYVSLEPCNHQGKTPPCTEALIQAGVARVVYGVADPHPEAGGGARRLREAGVDVVGPVWDERVGWAENPAFFHACRHDTPFVAIKLAVSLDGKVAERAGARTQLTEPEAQREAHRLRTGFDAVLVGSGTLRADDPRLTVRLVPPGRATPKRLVLDPRAELPADAAILQDLETAPVHVFVRADLDELHLGRLEGLGVHVHPVPADAGGRLSLTAVLARCRDLGIGSILCEGGPRLAASLLREGLAGRLYLFVAPITLGPEGVPAFPDDAHPLPLDTFRHAHPPSRHGRDVLIVMDRQEE